jgi:hypothetical protein
MLLARGVDIMTGPASSAAVGAVDVEEVQILRTIAELGFGRRGLRGDEFRIVAVKTERVRCRIETGIEGGRVFLFQQPVGGAAVRIVTADAIIDGRVLDFGALELFVDVGVTVQADLRGFVVE